MIVLVAVAANNSEFRDCDGYDEEYETEVDLSEDDREYCDQVEKLAILAGVQIVSFEFMAGSLKFMCPQPIILICMVQLGILFGWNIVFLTSNFSLQIPVPRIANHVQQ